MSWKWSLGSLAIPAVLSLVAFLVLSSQWLFASIEPGPLAPRESLVFNSLVVVLLICYARAVSTDPGRIPADWKPTDGTGRASSARQRWCRKCKAYKPPRAHHCKICKRCIPKMDHHCPWTVNCVSHITYPHFLRFVGYSDVALIYLEYFLFIRAAVVWENRHMPSYHGPSVVQLVHLFMLLVINSLTLFALGILWIRAVWCLVANTYTIETWEIERHDVLLRRAKVMGGFLDGPDGTRVRIVRQEFPYDIGLWSNIVQAMGTANVLAWLWPFAVSPSIDSGLVFETNGFEDAAVSWPPPDPDRMPRQKFNDVPEQVKAVSSSFSTQEIEAFRLRQQHDYERRLEQSNATRRRPIFHKRFDGYATMDGKSLNGVIGNSEEGEESWRTMEGDSLADYGVDEEVEFYDEEDIPLAQLMIRNHPDASS